MREANPSRSRLPAWVPIAAGLAAIALYAAFILVQGNSVRLPVVDELESWTAYYGAMTWRDLFAPHGATVLALANAPRVNFGSEFSIPILLHVLFPPIVAYIFVDMLAKLAGFAGMFLLLRRDLRIADPLLAAASALVFAFALVHHYAHFAVAALPLLAYAWLRLLKTEHRPWHVAVLLTFPFFSPIPFAFSAYLLLLLLTLWWIGRPRAVPRRALLVFAAMLCLAVIADWRLFAEKFFAPAFVFHRSEFANAYSLDTALARFVGNLRGQGYESSIRPLPFMAATIAAFTIFTLWRRPMDFRPLLLAAGGLAILFVAAFVNHPLFVLVTDRLLGLGDFSFERLDYMALPAFAIAFALALWGLARRQPGPAWFARAAALGLAMLQLAYLVYFSPPLFERRIGTPSVAEFYAPQAFARIAETIGLPKNEYRVLSLGILPSVAIFNGMQTADGYFSLYELSYKNAFREVIAGELEKSEVIRRSFDEWGNRLYVPSVELGDWPYASRALRDHPPVTVALDMAAAERLGARYLISAVLVANAQALGLKPLAIIDSDGGFYRLHLYEIAAPGTER
jgi:hypothetical protein